MTRISFSNGAHGFGNTGLTIMRPEHALLRGLGCIAFEPGLHYAAYPPPYAYPTATELRALAHAATMLADELDMAAQRSAQGPSWVFA